MCGYESDPKAKFNWVRHKGSTSSFQTGPTVDVTTGTGAGYYMYIETSYPQNKGDTARLISVFTPADSGKCLSFWYHAFGNGKNLQSLSFSSFFFF